MFWTKSFIVTLKDIPQEAETLTHQLMLRSGLVRMLLAGVYSYLPLGLRVLNNIEAIIREEMNACAAHELLLPALQPMELWAKTGRDKVLGEVMFKFSDRRGRDICLGPTHEEVVTDLVKNHVFSYRQLPLLLYQIQTKFRDEIRPRFGLIRACEFVMKDAYSFDRDEEGLERNYKAMYGAYNKIFKRCGLEVLSVEADPGIMGGNMSHEFMVPAESGEDVLLFCPQCRLPQPFKEEKGFSCPGCRGKLDKINAIEIGHVFKLGTKYSAVLNAHFLDAQGKQKPIIMGCYGIGVSRLIAAIIEQNHDCEGIIWPKEIAPFDVLLLSLDANDEKITREALKVYEQLKLGKVDVLMDDRDDRAGVKFKDADLIGIPISIIVGKKNIDQNKVEIKMRRSGESLLVDRNNLPAKINEILAEIK